LRASVLVGAPAWPSTSYSFADALDQEAFDQLELVTTSKFARLASDRGIRYLRRETLEWLDKQGAVRPIGFQTNSGKPALHSKRFSGWDRYARKVWDHPQVDALYSPWQLLYLDAAVNGRYVDVDVTAFLDSDTNLTAKPRSAWRQIHTRRHREWKRLDAAWRPVILLLVRIQNRYFPAVRGTVKMGLGGDDPFRREVASFDPKAVADELGWTSDDIQRLYEWLSFRGTTLDPAKGWFPIFRSLSYREQEKLKDVLRQAHDYYDAAAMLRRWYRDITGELLPDSDEVGAFPPDWRPNWLGHERRMTYDRKDMQRLLGLHGAYPNRIHVLVEGETEKAVLEELILAFRDTDPSALGVKIEPFSGVGNVTVGYFRSAHTPGRRCSSPTTRATSPTPSRRSRSVASSRTCTFALPTRTSRRTTFPSRSSSRSRGRPPPLKASTSTLPRATSATGKRRRRRRAGAMLVGLRRCSSRCSSRPMSGPSSSRRSTSASTSPPSCSPGSRKPTTPMAPSMSGRSSSWPPTLSA
jgi:hypothetical protein